MTDYVEMHRTGRGPGSNDVQIAAGNGFDAWVAATAITPPIATISTGDEWIFCRWLEACAWLNRSGELPSYRQGDQVVGSSEVLSAAMVATAHWGLETGWGANEWNWNAGGIHCAANAARCFRERAPRAGTEAETFEDFLTFADFAERYFLMVARTPDYASAWEAMRAGSANAILRLWRADYTCGAKTGTEASNLVLRVRRVVMARSAASARVLPGEGDILATDSSVPNRCTRGSRNVGRGGNGGGNGGGGNKGALVAALLVGAALLGK